MNNYVILNNICNKLLILNITELNYFVVDA